MANEDEVPEPREGEAPAEPDARPRNAEGELLPEVYDARPARHPGGRPSTFRVEFCQTAAELAANGATDAEIAEFLEVTPRTLYRWMAQFGVFREAVQTGKDIADDRVERTLYHKAIGYERETVKIIQQEGKPVVVRYTEHVEPDTAAAQFWLRNRRPEKWKDRRELTGLDGGPVEVRTIINFVDAPEYGDDEPDERAEHREPDPGPGRLPN